MVTGRSLYKGAMWHVQPGWRVIDLTRELGFGLLFVLLLGLYALGGGMLAPGAWAVLLAAVLGMIAMGQVGPSPLLPPLLLLGVALPPALWGGEGLHFLWVLSGTLLCMAALAGQARGPFLTFWLGRLLVGGVALRFLVGVLLRLPPTAELRFGLAVAISLLAGSVLSRGGWSFLLLFPFLAAGASVFDRLDWALIAFGVIVASIVGRRFGPGLILLLTIGILGLRAPADVSFVITSATDALLTSGPAILLAALWVGCEALAALRRSWKEEPKEIVLGSAAVLGLLAAALWVTDRASSGPSLFLAAFAVGLGLAARRREAEPSDAIEVGAPVRHSAGIAALAAAGAGLGALAMAGQGDRGAALSSLYFLVLLAVGHFAPGGLGHKLRAPVIFAALAWLVTRPFAAPVAPGSALWWQSPPAATALLALVAALAGAAHAVRRPGRIGAAQVAGAVGSLWLLGLLSLEDPGIAVRGEEPALNVAMGAFSVFMLFIAWAGPLEMGGVRPGGVARHLVGLPAVAVAFALLATLLSGWA